MRKYIAYIRVSSEKQGRSGLGLASQKEIIIHNVGYENIAEWYNEVHSAKNLNNLPELHKAKGRAKSEKLILVIAKTDRLRNTQQALDLVDELTPEGVFFCNVGRNADKFMLTLFFAFAEKERMEISIRTKAALAILKAKGVKLGRPISKETKEVLAKRQKKLSESGCKAMIMKSINNPANSAASSIALALRNKGVTFSSIADYLNQNSYKTPQCKIWIASSVYRLIKRFTENRFL